MFDELWGHTDTTHVVAWLWEVLLVAKGGVAKVVSAVKM